MDLLRWITVREAAKRLDFNVAYVMRLLHREQIEGAQTALGWLINPDSVTAYIQKRTDRYHADGSIKLDYARNPPRSRGAYYRAQHAREREQRHSA